MTDARARTLIFTTASVISAFLLVLSALAFYFAITERAMFALFGVVALMWIAFCWWLGFQTLRTIAALNRMAERAEGRDGGEHG